MHGCLSSCGTLAIKWGRARCPSPNSTRLLVTAAAAPAELFAAVITQFDAAKDPQLAAQPDAVVSPKQRPVHPPAPVVNATTPLQDSLCQARTRFFPACYRHMPPCSIPSWPGGRRAWLRQGPYREPADGDAVTRVPAAPRQGARAGAGAGAAGGQGRGGQGPMTARRLVLRCLMGWPSLLFGAPQEAQAKARAAAEAAGHA